MQNHVVVKGLFDVFSPEEAMQKLLDAVLKLFGDNASKALSNALKDIATFTPIDQGSEFFTLVYDGAFAIALLLGALATLLWLYRAVKLQEIETVWTVIKIVPIVYVLGASLPYMAYIGTLQLNEFNAGLVEFFTNESVTDNGFKIPSLGALSFVDSILAWMAGIALQLEAKPLVFYLPFVLAMLLVTLGLRWLGMLGNTFFAFMMGVFFVVLFGRTVIIGIVGLLVFAPQRFGYEPGGMVIAFSTLLAAASPIVMLVLYYKTHMSRKVHGVMESRLMSNRISASAGGESSGVARKAYQAAGAAAAGAIIAKAAGQQSEGATRGERFRNSSSKALSAKAMSAAATKHPVTAIAYITGSRLLKRPDKSD